MAIKWKPRPDTLEDLKKKLNMAEQSKEALDICVKNMRRSLLKNQANLDAIKIDERTKAILSTLAEIGQIVNKIERLKIKIKEKEKETPALFVS